MAERLLTLRELNRATLARQFLLERVNLSPLDVIKRLVALQGQVPNAPYIGLWTRLQAFERAELTSLLESRQVVRASSLRGTLHVMAAEDYLLMHPLLQSTLSRNLHLFAKQAEGFDMDWFCAEILAFIQEQPRTAVELRAKMEELYRGMGKQQIVDSVKMYLALIQPIPAGLWGFTGKPVHIEASSWLGQPLASPEAHLHQLILRYLAAFGPASVQDMQSWSGLTRLKTTVEELRPQLCTFCDELGRELFDLPHAPRPEADTPTSVRFLPDFDNLLFAYDDRRRIIADEYRYSIFIGNSRCTSFLVDGFVRGRWKVERQPASTTLVLEPFERLASSVQSELQEEGERLMHWISDDKEAFTIQWSSDLVSS